MRKDRDPRQVSQPTGLKNRGFTNGSHHFEGVCSKGRVNGFGFRGFGGLTNGGTNGRTNGRVNGKTNGRAQGKTNGLTNGHTDGRTNGRVNGRVNGMTNGRVNGRQSGRVLGRIDGVTNGFVNGAGAVNGFRLSYQQRRVAVKSLNMKRRIAAILVLVGIVICVPYVLVYTFPSEEIEIDGYFMDWLKAQVYEDRPDSPNPDIALAAYAMKYDARGSYFYIETAGTMFEGRDNGADGFYVFVDRDDNPATGYSVRGLGADIVSVIIGWNRTVQRGQTLYFNSSASQNDFNGFEPYSSVSVAFKGGKMEFSTGFTVTAASKVAVVARHTNIAEDWSEVNFRSRGSSLRVVQDHDASDVIVGTGDRHVLSLTIEGKGERTSVTGLRFNLLGNVTPAYLKVFQGSTLLGLSGGRAVDFVAPLHFSDRKSVSLDIVATIPFGATYGSFGLSLDERAGLVAAPGTVWHLESVQTGAKVSYLGSPPLDIVVDGAFADWSSRVPILDVLGDAYSAKLNDTRSGDVDIDTVKIASTKEVASFYMSVNGTMLGGSSVPTSLVRWVTPGPPAENITVITEPMLGADFAFVFIDTDMNQSTGFYIGGSEAAVVIIGKGGKILSSQVLTLERGLWNSVGPAEAALDNYQLELSAPYDVLGLVQGATYTVTFVAQDWSGRQDDIALALPARTTAGTRGFGGIMINEVYNRGAPPTDWIELYNTGSDPITISGWRLYVDGVLAYTFPSVTILPGEFYVAYNLDFRKGTSFVLTDASGSIVDQIQVPSWVMEKSYGRTGSPPYGQLMQMNPTPGAINQGQVPIPEFGDLAIPIAIMPVMVLLFRRIRGGRRQSGGP